MEGYKVSIRECSKDLTARERIAMKDLGEAIKLDEAITEDKKIVIYPEGYAILDIHNEKSDNPDYVNYVVFDKDGQKFVTGSESFWTSYRDIKDEMEGEAESWGITAYKLPSKKYTGKDFITCSIL